MTVTKESGSATPPKALQDIRTPALVLDLDVLDANLGRMARRCEALGVRLRPHVKTHKCLEVAERQRARGARGITVSTLEEARAFARHGFTDLTWAFPLIPGRLEETAELARQVRLGVTVDSREAVRLLEEAGQRFRVWLKVDCGYGRAGVDPGDPASTGLARTLVEAPDLELAGLLSHSGHAYAARSPEERAAVAEEERAVMVGFADRLREAGLEVPEVSVGSTPGMAAVRHLTGVTEARPGNYALYDYTQVLLGSCRVSECAATVLATVVSHRAGATHSVVDAGALALSKDTGPDWGPGGYGPLLAWPKDGDLHPSGRVLEVSQEHGIVDVPLPIGTRVRILPNHSCLTVACFDAFHVVRGGEVSALWKIRRERS